MPKAEEAAAPADGGGGGAGGDGRARSHQEGQEGRRRPRRTTRRSSLTRPHAMKAIVGLGNPGAKYPGPGTTSGSPWSTSWRGAGTCELRPWKSVARSWRWSATRGALLAKPLTFMNASGEAVGALLGLSQDRAGRCAGGGRRSAVAARPAAGAPVGIGRRPQRAEVDHRSTSATSFRGLRIGVGRGDPRWDLADHVLSRFDRDEARGRGGCGRRAADAAEMFVDDGDRGGDEPVQRRRSQSTTVDRQ